MMRIWGMILALGLLGGCVPSQMEMTSRSTSLDPGWPRMKTFAPYRPAAPRRANAEMVRDFIDLSFEVETGRRLPILTRFEGPISVSIAASGTPFIERELDKLISRLRREAKINISRVTSGVGRISIVPMLQADMQREVPHAACFVVPNVSTWNGFLQARRNGRISWVGLRKRETAAIFLPADASPQEIRDCLHEELAQALGPLNDLYRLGDSVFNDDNFHSVLTDFDMLMLAATYHPSLDTGMSRAEVEQKIPGILSQLNPRGDHIRAHTRTRTPTRWKNLMGNALHPGNPITTRQLAAADAVKLRFAGGAADLRDGFALYAIGRLKSQDDPDTAKAAFVAAHRIFAQHGGLEIHRAKVVEQLAAFALAEGDAERVLSMTDRYVSVARRHQNAAVLASLLMLRAEAFDVLSQHSRAQLLRLDSLAWARFGMGSGFRAQQHMAEIQALNPLGPGQ